MNLFGNLSNLDLIIIGIPTVVVFAVAFIMRQYLRSVADFLAASRCAGRYLLTTASAETGAAIMGTVAYMEQYSKSGNSLGMWGAFTGFVFFMLTMLGFVTYRFRETRALTFHQFFEIRYSKNLRGFASFLNVFSGLFNFGLAPGIMARFFVYFCDLPDVAFTIPTPWGGIPVPSMVIIMIIFIAISLFMTLTGGQISVMVTDCLEGIISGVFYAIVAIAIFFFILNKDQMQKAMLSGPPGKSFINPFDISGQPDFNGWYIVMGFIMGLLIYRGNAWLGGFAASAKSAHEGKMSGILAIWRGQMGSIMGGLICIGALTLLNHADFVLQKQAVEETINRIPEEQIRTQMTMPVALSQLLPSGIKGCFLAIAIFGTLAGLGAQMHSFGSTFFQDTFLPYLTTIKRTLNKIFRFINDSLNANLSYFDPDKLLSPKTHVMALQLCALGVGLFGIFFSIVYKPPEYLVMLTSLIGAIYLGGIGSCVLGGLYWKKGTTQGAWAALIVGSILAFFNWMMLNSWTTIAHWQICSINPYLTTFYQLEGTLKNATTLPWINKALVMIYHPTDSQQWVFNGAQSFWGFDPKPVLTFFLKHQDRSPLNGMILSFISYITAAIAYLVVSLLTCKEDFNMDRMLHRGKYKIEDVKEVNVPKPGKKWTWGSLIGIDEYYSRGDKIIAVGTFSWSIFWNTIAIGIMVCNLFFFRWKDEWWFNWMYYQTYCLGMVIGMLTTIWFTIGASVDMVKLIRSLRTVERNDADDGTVRDHHNVGETEPTNNKNNSSTPPAAH